MEKGKTISVSLLAGPLIFKGKGRRRRRGLSRRYMPALTLASPCVGLMSGPVWHEPDARSAFYR